MSDGWYTEEPFFSDTWLLDAPWIKSSETDSETYNVAGKEYVARGKVSLRWLNRDSPARALFYGKAQSETDFVGLSEYYNTRDPEVAQNAVNVLDGASSSEVRTSIYLVGWSPRAIYMASDYGGAPQGSCPTKCAVVIKDWRYCVRIANFDPFATSRDDLLALMYRAKIRLPGLRSNTLRPIFYMNSDVGKLWLAAEPPENLEGIPVRLMPELRNDEERL